MDPLSIMASLVGLMTAASNVSSLLSTVKSSMRDAPQLLSHVLCEVKDVAISLSAIHKFLSGTTSAPKRRLELIQLDQLIATLTGAVLTFSELEDMVNPLAAKSSTSIKERLKWALKEDKIMSIIQRLQRHKSSLSLMLNIIQCGSDFEAEQSRDTLLKLIEQLLENSQDISQRLRNIENTSDSQTTLTRYLADDSIEPMESETLFTPPSKADGEEVGFKGFDFQFTNCDIFSAETASSELSSPELSFEDDLKLSRVYSRTQLYKNDVSFVSSVVRTHAWSVYSGLSLAEVSMISAIALPVYSHDISNSYRYNFGDTGLTGHRARALVPNPSSMPSIARDPLRKSTSAVSKIRDYASDIKVFPRRKSAPTGRSEVPKLKLYKIVVLGDEGVGKDELVRHLSLSQDPEKHDAPLKGSFMKQVEIENQPCMLEISETSAGDDHTALQDQLIRDGEGYVLVYSIHNRASFDAIRKYHQRVNKVKESVLSQFFNLPYVPTMLVGNNSDLKAERRVSYDEGYVLSRELGCEFLEVSSRDGINVENAFFDVVRLLRLRKKHKE